MPNVFETIKRVYYDDTDCAGVVYHTNYLKWMEQARSEWFLSLGYDAEAMKDQDAYFVVASLQIDFFSPAHLYDQVIISSRIQAMSRITITFEQTVALKQNPNKILCRAIIKVPCITQNFKPRPIPELLRSQLYVA